MTNEISPRLTLKEIFQEECLIFLALKHPESPDYFTFIQLDLEGKAKDLIHSVDTSELEIKDLNSGDLVVGPTPQEIIAIQKRYEPFNQQTVAGMLEETERVSQKNNEDKHFMFWGCHNIKQAINTHITPEAYNIPISYKENRQPPTGLIEAIEPNGFLPSGLIESAILRELFAGRKDKITLIPVVEALVVTQQFDMILRKATESLLWETRLHGSGFLAKLVNHYPDQLNWRVVELYSHFNSDPNWVLSAMNQTNGLSSLSMLFEVAEDFQFGFQAAEILREKLRRRLQPNTLEEQRSVQILLQSAKITIWAHKERGQATHTKPHYTQLLDSLDDEVILWVEEKRSNLEKVDADSIERISPSLSDSDIQNKYHTTNPDLVEYRREQQRVQALLPNIREAIRHNDFLYLKRLDIEALDLVELLEEENPLIFGLTDGESTLVKQARKLLDERRSEIPIIRTAPLETHQLLFKHNPRAKQYAGLQEPGFWYVLKAGIQKDLNHLRFIFSNRQQTTDQIKKELAIQLGLLAPESPEARTMLKQISQDKSQLFSSRQAQDTAQKFLRGFGYIP